VRSADAEVIMVASRVSVRTSETFREVPWTESEMIVTAVILLAVMSVSSEVLAWISSAMILSAPSIVLPNISDSNISPGMHTKIPKELWDEILGWKRRRAWKERLKYVHDLLKRTLLIIKDDLFFMYEYSIVNEHWAIYFYVTVQGVVFRSKYYGPKKKPTLEDRFELVTNEPRLESLLLDAVERGYCFLELHCLVEEWYDREFELNEVQFLIANEQPMTQFIQMMIYPDENEVVVHVYYVGRLP